jgi:2-polyprenyl-3-methyl-5-hydroxy-6-metoxy-1,4-benzoquinol methylase
MNFNWDTHYKQGGQSGIPDDYVKSRGWKHELISRHFNAGSDTMIDMACGDLQFWNDNPPKHYTGVDISQTIIDRHTKNHPLNKFICSNAATPLDIKADVVICFDMLWHIIDDDEYVKTLHNIKSYANNYIYIYTWNSDPETFITGILKHFVRNKPNVEYQKYRNYRKISDPILFPEFKLIETYRNDVWKIGTMYVYQRI